jgi:NAD(P)-dependent dehydrogenase (short-subunit alcohol dehydrogenase family)
MTASSITTGGSCEIAQHVDHYGASKAALLHLGRIWDAELRGEGIRVVSIDPGDMDTPLHELAVPGADRSALKRPEDAAREIADTIAALTMGPADPSAKPAVTEVLR